MAKAYASKSAAVRARLSHPVIDSDGHTVEFEPGRHGVFANRSAVQASSSAIKANAWTAWCPV